MARRTPGFLVFLVLFVVAAVSAGAVVWLLVLRLPDPEVAGPRDLLRWIATEDLSRHSDETQWTLARRLDEVFGGHIEWSAEGQDPLAPAQQTLMLSNVALLMKPWLLLKADDYCTLPQRERMAYVDRVLDSFQTWQGADQLMGGSSTTETGILGTILNRIEECRQEATPQQQQKINQFLFALECRWLKRVLLGPGGTG